MALYFVATTGSDSGTGSYADPWETIQYGIDSLSAGDTLYLRGGTYYPYGTSVGTPFGTEWWGGIGILNRSGSTNYRYTIQNYLGETPVIDGQNLTAAEGSVGSRFGIVLRNCSYWTFKGIEVRNVAQFPTELGVNGIRFSEGCTHNILERVVSHDNGGSGICFVYDHNANLILNCDSYNNSDPYSVPDPYNNSDGFDISEVTVETNYITLIGCRAWGNSDDGYDLFDNEGIVTMINCWAFNNYKDYSNDWANGFKLGRTNNSHGTVRRILHNCLAINNQGDGFTTGGDGYCDMNLFNCVAISNTNGFHFYLETSADCGTITVRNNIAYGNTDNFRHKYAAMVADHNSYDSDFSPTGPVITDADFVSVDSSQLTLARKAGGTLPLMTYLHPTSTSGVLGEGIAIAGLTDDGDGEPYTNPPVIGTFTYVDSAAESSAWEEARDSSAAESSALEEAMDSSAAESSAWEEAMNSSDSSDYKPAESSDPKEEPPNVPESFDVNEIKYDMTIYDKARIRWIVKFFVNDNEELVETLKGGPDPIVFEWQNGSDDVYDPWKPSQVTLTVAVTENFKFTDLFSPNLMSVFIKIYQDGETDADLFWQGWLDPTQYEEPYDVAPFYLTIVATDGLSLLADMKYASQDSLGDTEYYSGRMLESQIVWNILEKLGVDQFKEYLSIYELRMANSVNDSPMDQLYLDNARFFDMNCQDVLIECLKKQKACIRMKDGVFCIYRPKDSKKTTVYGRKFTSGTVHTSISYAPAQYIYRRNYHPAHESALRQIPGGTTMQQFPAKKININQDYGSKDSWLENHTLHANTYQDFEFEGWSHVGAVIPVPVGNFVKGEEEGALMVQTGNVLAQGFGEYVKATDDTEIYTLEFEYGLFSRLTAAVSAYCRFCLTIGENNEKYAVRINDGNDCAWANTITSPGYNLITLTGVNYGWNGWNTIQLQFKGLPLAGRLTFAFTSGTTSVYATIKNVRFYAQSTNVTKYTYKRSFWERIRVRSTSSEGISFSKLRPKYVLKTKNTIAEKVTEYTYNPVTNITHGVELDYDHILGDVIKESFPARDSDTGLSNNLNQFSGSMAISSSQTLPDALASWISTNYAAFLAADVIISYEGLNSAGNPLLRFTAQVPGVDIAGAAATITPGGDITGEAYTLQANLAGNRQFAELTISGSSGSLNITFNEQETYTMNWYGSSLEETIQHFIDLYGAYIALLYPPVELAVGSGGNTLEMLGDIYGNAFTYYVDPNGLTATETYSVSPGDTQARTDEIELLSGSSGTATFSCAGVSRTFTIGVTITESAEWAPADEDSSGYAKPLLELMGDEVAEQYSRPKQLIDMPIQETIAAPSTLNVIGGFQDDLNKYNGVNRRFVMNRGSFSVRNRRWDIDLIEII